MNRLPKIPISPLTDAEMAKIKAKNIRKARVMYAAFPAATRVYLCLKTGLPLKFIMDNWEEITNA
jgi:hypothetical protein